MPALDPFAKLIAEGKVGSEEELKRLFWKLAKALHPDVSAVENNHERFLKLKDDYDRALALLRAPKVPVPVSTRRPPGRKECVDLFIDLLAGNFPVDLRIRNQRKYLSRIEELNEGLGGLEGGRRDLFLDFERELYELRGDSVVLNHEYSLLKLYLYQFSSYVHAGTPTGGIYLRKEYPNIVAMLRKRKMESSARFIDWLVGDIVGPAGGR
ncbi:MAG: hypothetical protein JNG85_01840 [Spirochaetaceae bacterium]|nr:hypothetical protein [Spirochaetaceae bacterium]